ncbi:Lar family restriction alleviation protein [Brevundimonas diminuta]
MARIAKAKPCPFCRSTDSFVECADFGSFYRVCNDCLARGPEAEGEGCDPDAENARGARNATRAWNRRPRAADLQAEQGAK